jgi:hypothetical protein
MRLRVTDIAVFPACNVPLGRFYGLTHIAGSPGEGFGEFLA